jgi:hypothetical protein
MTQENQHTIAGLLRKRKEMAGIIEDMQIRMRQQIIDLDALDQTIRLFAPDIDLEEIKPSPVPPRHSAFRGEIARLILNALRETGRAMTSKELSHHVMTERGLNVSDKRLVRTMTKRIGACLKHYKHKGTLHAKRGPGSFLLWEIRR